MKKLSLSLDWPDTRSIGLVTSREYFLISIAFIEMISSQVLLVMDHHRTPKSNFCSSPSDGGELSLKYANELLFNAQNVSFLTATRKQAV